jgi:phosphonate transport system ATP-binding protein
MLRVCGLTMRFPDGKVALAKFDLSVAAGELVVVLGGNGSGKTTLLRCIARVLFPTAGEIWLDGTNLAVLSGERLRQARLLLAMIWQQASLVRRRSVLSNVAAGALGRYQGLWTALGGLPPGERRAAYGYLSEVGLASLAGQRAGTLSGGQAQRVAIARALAQRPQVLLADEPVASLDPEAADGIMRLLRHLAADDNLAVLCVLHQVELAYAYADRVVGIRDGRIAFDLPSCELPREAVHQLYLGAVALSLDATAPQLAERGWPAALGLALRLVTILGVLLIVVQSAIVVHARPQDLVTGAYGMADIIRRAMPPDFGKIGEIWRPALETVDIAIFGTLGGIVMALPLAVLAAVNVTPSRYFYYAARGVIGFARAVPDLVWALLFVTAVGLGPFPGALALSVHSIGMLGRLFAETIEHMEMAPIVADPRAPRVNWVGVVSDQTLNRSRGSAAQCGPGRRRSRRRNANAAAPLRRRCARVGAGSAAPSARARRRSERRAPSRAN